MGDIPANPAAVAVADAVVVAAAIVVDVAVVADAVSGLPFVA
jgi:hypothetical protein